jgi:hypothetical protein
MTSVFTVDVGERGATALLGEAAVVIWNDVSREGREQFYAWHDREHIPERLSIPGFRRGRRFARASHSPEWLTIYEADNLAVLTSAAYLARLNTPTPATERVLRYFRNTSRAVCRIVHSKGSNTGGYMLAMRLSLDPAQAGALREYLTAEAFPRAMGLTGVVACHLCAADERASYADTAESSTRKFDVPSWVLLCEASFEAAAENARRLFEGPELDRLGVDVRGDSATYALEISRLSPTRTH